MTGEILLPLSPPNGLNSSASLPLMCYKLIWLEKGWKNEDDPFSPTDSRRGGWNRKQQMLTPFVPFWRINQILNWNIHPGIIERLSFGRREPEKLVGGGGGGSTPNDQQRQSKWIACIRAINVVQLLNSNIGNWKSSREIKSPHLELMISPRTGL